MTDIFVREDVRAFLDMVEAAARPPMSEQTPAEAREGMRVSVLIAEAPPRELALIRDLSCPGPAGDIPLRLYDSRAERGPSHVVMFYHGGGFTIGSVDTHHAFCTEVAAALDLPVVSVEYRLAPEAPFPAAPDDCEAATRWVAGSPDALGREVTGVVTMGDSAGGNLAIVIANALVDAPADVPVVLQAPIYPIADDIAQHDSYKVFGDGYLLTRDSMRFFDDCYAPAEGDIRNHPILREAVPGTPPAVICTAGLDPLRDSGRNYAAHLIRAGIDTTYLEFPGVIHGFVTLRKLIASGQRDVETFLAACRSMLEART